MKIFRVRPNPGEMTAYVLRHEGMDCARYWAVEKKGHFQYVKKVCINDSVVFGGLGKSVCLDREDALKDIRVTLREEATSDAISVGVSI